MSEGVCFESHFNSHVTSFGAHVTASPDGVCTAPSNFFILITLCLGERRMLEIERKITNFTSHSVPLQAVDFFLFSTVTQDQVDRRTMI